MKKHLLIIVLMLLPMVANAVEVNGINYQLYNGATPTAAVIKKDPNYSGDVVIPKSFVYNGTTYTVTDIDNSAFRNCKELTSISIPETVNEIAIGNGVTALSSGLVSIVVHPDNLVYDSRDNCNAIIETKTNKLIAGCNNTVIPANVTAIGDHAFQDMDGLTTLEIPSSVTSIGMQAFNMCDGITTLAIPNSVTTIDYLAFSWMSNLKSIVIGTGITNFEDAAFQDCHALTSVTLLSQLPPTVSDGDDPFFVYPSSSMKGQITLYVPKGSKSAYQADAYWGTFAGIEEVSPEVEVDGIRYELNGKNATVISKESGYEGSIQIPETVSYQGMDYDVIGIGENAFSQCFNLTSVSIPSSVLTIGNYAFHYCSGLTSVTIPDGVVIIGDYAFFLCQNLTSISLGNNVNTIGEGAFYYCENLNSIVLPASLSSVESLAFCFCSAMTFVTSLAMTPPGANDDAFDNYNIPLYVSKDVLTDYQAASPWNKFSSIQVARLKCATPTIHYVDGIISFSSETPDVEFKSSVEKTITGTSISPDGEYTVKVYATKDGYDDSDVASFAVTLELEPQKGDVDGDGVIDIADAVRIVNFIVGKINAFARQRESTQPEPE
jgi:hypothetical protein